MREAGLKLHDGSGMRGWTNRREKGFGGGEMPLALLAHSPLHPHGTVSRTLLNGPGRLRRRLNQIRPLTLFVQSLRSFLESAYAQVEGRETWNGLERPASLHDRELSIHTQACENASGLLQQLLAARTIIFLVPGIIEEAAGFLGTSILYLVV